MFTLQFSPFLLCVTCTVTSPFNSQIMFLESHSFFFFYPPATYNAVPVCFLNFAFLVLTVLGTSMIGIGIAPPQLWFEGLDPKWTKSRLFLWQMDLHSDLALEKIKWSKNRKKISPLNHLGRARLCAAATEVMKRWSAGVPEQQSHQ